MVQDKILGMDGSRMRSKFDFVVYIGTPDEAVRALILNPETYVELGAFEDCTSVGERLARAVEKIKMTYPCSALSRAVAVLSDGFFARDTVTIPTSDIGTAERALTFDLNRTYSDRQKDEIRTSVISHGGGKTVFSVTAIRGGLCRELRDSASRLGIELTCIISSAQARIYSAVAESPSLKRGAFSILDILDKSSQLIFVKDTVAIGSYGIAVGRDRIDEAQLIAGTVLGENTWLREIGDFGKIYVSTESKKQTSQERANNADLYGATLLGHYKKSIVFGGAK